MDKVLLRLLQLPAHAPPDSWQALAVSSRCFSTGASRPSSSTCRTVARMTRHVRLPAAAVPSVYTTSTPHTQAAPLFDAVLFKKIAARLGGRIKLIISGGAPLAKHVEEFLRVTMCAAVVQGYGLTETCAGSFIALPQEYVCVSMRPLLTAKVLL